MRCENKIPVIVVVVSLAAVSTLFEMELMIKNQPSLVSLLLTQCCSLSVSSNLTRVSLAVESSDKTKVLPDEISIILPAQFGIDHLILECCHLLPLLLTRVFCFVSFQYWAKKYIFINRSSLLMNLLDFIC